MKHARDSRIPLWIALAVLLGVGLPTSGVTQTIRVTVLDDQTQQPVASALVELYDSTGALLATDLSSTSGEVAFDASGTHFVLRIRRIGYDVTVTPLFKLPEGRQVGDVTVLVTALVVVMDPVTITGDSAPYAPGPLADFYARRRRGWGHFITPEEVRERNPAQTTDLFRLIAGVRVVPRGAGSYDVVMTRNALTSLSAMQRSIKSQGGLSRTRNDIREANDNVGLGDGKCQVTFYLDGGKFRPDPQVGINQILASDVTAVEVYRGPAETPVEFLDSDSRCGVIVIWTRRGPEN
jgi:hypothetical protein